MSPDSSSVASGKAHDASGSVAGGRGTDDIVEAVERITHDLNNLLGVMLNYAALLGAEIDELAAASPDAKRFDAVTQDLGQITRAVADAVELTARLHAVAREAT